MRRRSILGRTSLVHVPKKGRTPWPVAEALERRRLLTAIVSGQTLSGTITNTSQATYTFSIPGGSSFFFSMDDADANSAIEPKVTVYDASNTVVSQVAQTTNDTAAEVVYPVFANDGGTFTAVVQDDTGTHSGAYDVELVGIPNIVQSDSDGDGGMISPGTTRSGTLNRPGDLDAFQFSAGAGQNFILSLGDADASSNVHPELTVWDPSGALVFAPGSSTTNSSAQAALEVPTSGGGIYTVVVKDQRLSGTGLYDLELAMPSVPNAPDADGDSGQLSPGLVRTGTSNRPGDIDLFQFYGSADASLTLTLADASASSGFEPAFKLYDPSGNSVEQKSRATNSSVTAKVTVPSGGAQGEYTVVVEQADGSGVGPYLLRLSSGTPPPITGTSGAVTPGASPTIGFKLTGNLGFSAAATALSVQALPSGTAVTSTAVSYDPGSGTATFTVPALANGYYEATLPAGSVTDFAGDTLASAVNLYFLYDVATGGGDVISVQVDPTHTTTSISNGTTVVASGTRSLLDAIAIEGGDGNDTLTYDSTNQPPLLAGSTVFDGGNGNDAISIIGTSSSDTLTFASGSVSFGSTLIQTPSVEAASFDGKGGSDALTISGGPTVTIAPSQVLNSFSLTGTGSAKLSSGGDALVTRDITMDPTAELDMGSASMIVDYEPGATPLSRISGYLKTGFNGGKLNAPSGLTSSSVNATNPSTALGIVDNAQHSTLIGYAYSTFAGVPVDASSVLIRYTLVGDADLDGGVGLDDFNLLASHLGSASGQTWDTGDFNYDGGVGLDDLNLLATNFGKTLIDSGDVTDGGAVAPAPPKAVKPPATRTPAPIVSRTAAPPSARATVLP